MKALVTGATGFAGSTLVRELCRLKSDVRVLARSARRAEEMFDGLGIDIHEGDIVDPQAVDKAVKGIDKVYHIAAVYRTAGISDQVYRDVHVKGTENVMNGAFQHKVDRMMHCSTVGVHGHIDDPPADETYRFAPADIYQETKLAGERAALEFSARTGLPVSVIRPCAIYGPGDMRLYKLFRLAARKFVPVIGSGNIFYHMVYVDDLIQGFILAGEKEEAVGKAFIIGGEEIPTLNQLIDQIADLDQRKPLKIHLPAKPFQAAGSLFEKICVPLNFEPPIYRRRVDFFTKSRAFDISKAKAVLGYQPKVGLRDGLEKTARWYRQQGLLN